MNIPNKYGGLHDQAFLAMGDRCGAYDSLSPLSTDEVGWHERCWGGKGSEIHIEGDGVEPASEGYTCGLFPKQDHQDALKMDYEIICLWGSRTRFFAMLLMLSSNLHFWASKVFGINELWTTSSRFARHIQRHPTCWHPVTLPERIFKHGSGR